MAKKHKKKKGEFTYGVSATEQEDALIVLEKLEAVGSSYVAGGSQSQFRGLNTRGRVVAVRNLSTVLECLGVRLIWKQYIKLPPAEVYKKVEFLRDGYNIRMTDQEIEACVELFKMAVKWRLHCPLPLFIGELEVAYWVLLHKALGGINAPDLPTVAEFTAESDSQVKKPKPPFYPYAETPKPLRQGRLNKKLQPKKDLKPRHAPILREDGKVSEVVSNRAEVKKLLNETLKEVQRGALEI